MTQLDYYLTSLFLLVVFTFISACAFTLIQDAIFEYGKKQVLMFFQKVAFFALPFIGVVVLVVSML